MNRGTAQIYCCAKPHHHIIQPDDPWDDRHTTEKHKTQTPISANYGLGHKCNDIDTHGHTEALRMTPNISGRNIAPPHKQLPSLVGGKKNTESNTHNRECNQKMSYPRQGQ